MCYSLLTDAKADKEELKNYGESLFILISIDDVLFAFNIFGPHIMIVKIIDQIFMLVFSSIQYSNPLG